MFHCIILNNYLIMMYDCMIFIWWYNYMISISYYIIVIQWYFISYLQGMPFRFMGYVSFSCQPTCFQVFCTRWEHDWEHARMQQHSQDILTFSRWYDVIVSTNCAASSSTPKISFSVFEPVQGILIPNSECLQLYDACLIMFPNQRQCAVTPTLSFQKKESQRQ